jgi:hypothetical protein
MSNEYTEQDVKDASLANQVTENFPDADIDTALWALARHFDLDENKDELRNRYERGLSILKHARLLVFCVTGEELPQGTVKVPELYEGHKVWRYLSLTRRA